MASSNQIPVQIRSLFITDSKAKDLFLVSMMLRYAVGLFAMLFLFGFKDHLPFPYPQFFFVAVALIVANGALHLFSLKKKWFKTAFLLLPYFDVGFAPLVYCTTGGFLSPFSATHLITTIGSGILYTSNKYLAVHSFFILLISYLTVSFLQKFGVLPCYVDYVQTMMNNSFFFYFVVCITCAIFAIGYLMVQMLNAHVHKMLDDMTKTFDSILKGTISVVGKDFFELLSKNLCETLSARCVYIGELSGKSQLLKPVVTWKDGALHTAPDLSIQISLVTDLISQDILIVDTKACEKYADSTLLQSCKADVLICSTLHDAKGKPIGILCLLHDDILPNRYLVDPLISIFASRAASELERKITEEKQKYIEMQLAQAHKMEAIGQLVSGISHDFNNMLSAMIGYAQLLYNRLEPESPLRRFAEHILNAGNCNADLITKLTQFARRGTPHLAPVDIHKAIEDAIILLERTVDKSICIVKNLDAVQSTSLGDHTLIQNLFMNMGINARDAMDNKQGILTFSTSVSELKEQSVQCQTFNIPPGHYIAVSITDNGSGMSEETLGHLFEPFYTTKPKGKGTGLGLSNVWGYVENYKGAIDVKSKLGTGTTFTIYFPVVETQDTQPSKSFKATPQPLSIKNILVADDEPAMRDITKAQLEQSGFSVVAFENGALALEYCKKK